MREPRNPFRIRSAEAIEFDSTFLRLFGPGVLEVIPQDRAWNTTLIFRSAPGGGKTSLLRLFTPTSLLSLYDYRTYEDYKDLYESLKGLGVISDEGPHLLGVMLSCARNYADLEDLAFEKTQKTRLFFSLLNSRIIIAMLRNALSLRKLSFPNDLERIEIRRPTGFDIPSTIPIPCTGKTLYDWASSLEREVCSAIDSFGPPPVDSLVGHDTLYSLFLLRPECIIHEGSPVAKQTLLMLDDVHKLAKVQREKLRASLVELRPPIGVWQAERLEALETRDLLGATEGREFNEIVLEEFWGAGNSKRFENTLSNIADRRTKLNPDFEGGPFAGLLQSSLDGLDWHQQFTLFGKIVASRVKSIASTDRTYAEWVRARENLEGTPREQAVKWRTLEILIERDARRAQQRLVDSPLGQEELIVQEGSDVKEAAELFLSKEFKLPYYFGFPKLVKLSSSNIEQFLELAGELFEEVMSLKVLKQPLVVNAKRQEDILRTVAAKRWNNIATIPEGNNVRRFLKSIGDLCRDETQRPNAPYSPGATGFGISMTDRELLIDAANQKMRPEFGRVSKVISSCLANNLLEVYLDQSQGQRGKKWMILYLNRLLCLYFGLPLQYGGWRPLSLTRLSKFVELPAQKVEVTLE